MRRPRIRGKAIPDGSLVGHTVKAPRRNVAWNTTEIAYNSTEFKRSPGRATRRKVRASTIPPKRLIPFGHTIEHLSVLFLCKEGEEVGSELLRILIQVATHHSHKNTAIERPVYLSKSTKFCMRYAARRSSCTKMSVPFAHSPTARYAGERSRTGSG